MRSWKVALVAILGALAAVLVLGQPGGDPWWRPLNPQGQSWGITVGNTLPTTDLGAGELALDVDANRLYLRNTAAGWDSILTISGGGGTLNTVSKFDGAGSLINSTIVDDGTNVDVNAILTVGSAFGVANSVTLSTNQVILEGATANDFENIVEASDQTTGDATLSFPLDNADWDGTASFVVADGANNAPHGAAGVWIQPNAVYFEGNTANTGELVLSGFLDPGVGADQFLRLPRISATVQEVGTLLVTLVDAGEPETTTALWADANQLIFEGTAEDAFETVIQAADVTVADTIYQLSNHQLTVYPVVSVSDTVVPDAANSIWVNSGILEFEGATADAFEGLVLANDFLGGVDLTITLATPAAGASGTLVSIATTLAAMDAVGGDIVNGVLLDLANADHTGGTLSGIRIDTIVGDAQAAEYAVNIGGGWDAAMWVADGSATDDAILFGDDIDAGIYWANAGVNLWIDAGQFGTAGSVVIRGTGNASSVVMTVSDGTEILGVRTAPAAGAAGNIVSVTDSLAAMDAGADVVNAFLVDLTNGSDHLGGYLNGINIDTIAAADPQAVESALFIGSGWDFHMTLQSLTASPTNNPAAGAVALFIDDNTDWSGAGGNDCALVARDSAGATDIIATLVLNGPCP